jgi:Na+-driven multidrug efflux pump
MVVMLSRLKLIMFGLRDDAKIMHIGIAYTHIVGSCCVFFVIMFIPNGVISGVGHTIITMVFFCCRYGSYGCPYMVLVENEPWGLRDTD